MKAIIFLFPGRQIHAIGAGKTIKAAVNRVAQCCSVQAERYGVDVFGNDGLLIFTAYGDTLAQAVEEAKNMDTKSRSGGGR